MTKPNLPVEERFFLKVNKTDTCWLWIGTITKNYGQIGIKGKSILAHRLSFEMHNDIVLTRDQLILHLCDNRRCVNPEHLIMCTEKDKTEYAVNKGRHARMRSCNFLNPFGIKVTIDNLNKFSRENNLSINSLSRVNRGERKSYKGYTKFEISKICPR